MSMTVYSDTEGHPDHLFVDQVTVLWSNGNKTLIGGCTRNNAYGQDCESVITNPDDKYWVPLKQTDQSGFIVYSILMAVTNFGYPNTQPGQLLGKLLVNVVKPNDAPAERRRRLRWYGYTGQDHVHKYEIINVSVFSLMCGLSCPSDHLLGRRASPPSEPPDDHKPP